MSESIEEAIDDLATDVGGVARAITARVAGGTDAAGGHVECLTEAVMGVTAALVQIAGAINRLAEAHEDKEDSL